MNWWITAGYVFVAMAVADAFWALWSINLTKNNPVAAATYGALIVLCGAFSIVEYTTDHWLVIPAVLGAWTGTFVSVAAKATEP